METKTYKGGAPKKAEADCKTRIVRVLFNEHEYARILERKGQTRAANLSDFIRTICLDKPMRIKAPLTTHQENVLSLVREMRDDVLRIGVNINQASKRINSTTDYHNLQADVNLLVGDIGRIDSQLRLLIGTVLNIDSSITNPTIVDGSSN